MENILQQLYDAPIGCNSQHSGADSSFIKMRGLKSRNLDKLLMLLTDEQKEIFERYSEVDRELGDITRFENFSYGVQLGARFILEIMRASEGNYSSLFGTDTP